MIAADLNTKSTVSKNGIDYRLVNLITDQGVVACHYYKADSTKDGVIFVGGVGGDFDTPAKGLYPLLCQQLLTEGISSLWIEFREPSELTGATSDIRSGIAFLEGEGITSIGLVGYSLGGAAVIRAGARSQNVKTVVTLSTQGEGADPVSTLAPRVSILLIHGSEDQLLSPLNSIAVFQEAKEPKQLIIYEGATHNLDEAALQVFQAVYSWLFTNIRKSSYYQHFA